MALSDSQSHIKEEAGIEVDNNNNKNHQVEEEQGESENNRVSAMSPNSAVPATQLTIFYNGAISVFDAITPEKAQAIMLIAAASAAASRTASTNKTKINTVANGNAAAASAGAGVAGGFTSATVSAAAAAALTRSLSQQSSSVAATAVSPQVQLPASPGATSISKLQAGLPIARRTSLQQFLEKRRNRIVSKAPYASAKKPDEDLEAGMEAKPQLV